MSEILGDLQTEQDALDAVLSQLAPDAWAAPSAASGWSVADVVLHLAQTEEAVVRVVTAGEFPGPAGDRGRVGATVDEMMDAMVRGERAGGAEVFARWRAAREVALAALRAADPHRPVPWVETALKPLTLATTRLAEHWAHALDITGPLGIPYPDTGRLRHVAWLAHGTLRYAFTLAGHEPQEVFCAVTAPDGTIWRYGPPDAASSVTGTASDFCRVAARRLDPAASGLVASGPAGPLALRLMRTYA